VSSITSADRVLAEKIVAEERMQKPTSLENMLRKRKGGCVGDNFIKIQRNLN